MPISRCFAIAVLGFCSILGAAGACSSDSQQGGYRDAETNDASLDRSSPHDAVTPDAADVDVSQTDAALPDATRTDVSSDVVPGDARVDAPLSDRTSNDVLSSDGTSGDSASADMSTIDSTRADAPPPDSTATDAPAADGGNDPRCPPSYGAASGQACTPGSPTCVYAEGTCGCLMGCGALPPPDAGNRWFCGMRGAGCPIQKPTAGSPCTMDAQSCNYGTCCTDLMVCENDAWKSGGILCPP